MVWAWNLVCGRFISFEKGRKFFDLIDFQLPQWSMRKNKKKLATFAKLLTVAFLFSVRQSVFLRWKLKISGYVFYGQDLMNFENVVVKFLRFFASQADYGHNTIVVPSQYHYNQGCGAVVKMTQFRLRSSSFHDHGSSSNSGACDVIFTFANQRFGEVCRQNMHIQGHRSSDRAGGGVKQLRAMETY